MSSQRFVVSSLIYKLVFILIGYGCVLAIFPAILPNKVEHRLFSESGPFELLSCAAWIALGAWCFDPVRRLSRELTVCGLIAFLAAAREADFHKLWTTDSVFKIRYYAKTVAPLYEKIPAAIVAIGSFALLIYALYLGLRFARRGLDALKAPWFQVLLLGVAATAFTKVLDRLHSWLRDGLGYDLSGYWAHLNGALEEGYELSLPLMFLLALLLYRRSTETVGGTPLAPRLH